MELAKSKFKFWVPGYISYLFHHCGLQKQLEGDRVYLSSVSVHHSRGMAYSRHVALEVCRDAVGPTAMGMCSGCSSYLGKQEAEGRTGIGAIL